ncbi:SAM-dependent methyltransferase [Myroides sp. LJL119]
MSATATPASLYLIPITLGETQNPLDVLPLTIQRCIESLDIFIVENEKVARRFIKSICPEKKQSELVLFPLNKHTDSKDLKSYIQPLLQGKSVGLMSDAGCPGVADPGAIIVDLAHKNNIKVRPLVGPSSILLAMMASGMNGQSFAFNGYLPIDKAQKKTSLKQLEKLSFDINQSQLFIETPYRNNQLLEDMIHILHPQTLICIACDITLQTEYIQTKTANEWKKQNIDLHKRPCIFIIHKPR